ncbi:MAG: phosphate acyltransferase PlsX [Phascolarctobacterium sp.]|nr:phosphate acyltransferase PlsX [Phascolarctobacterium sp.]
MKIVVDCMGTDYGPKEIVLGAVDAVKKYGCEVVLVGEEKTLTDLVKQYGYASNEKVTIKNATQVIEMHEHPALAFRQKKDASIVVASKMLKAGEVDALVSSGSTGAAVASALFGVGRIKGVDKPVIALPMPSVKGHVALLDAGGVVDAKPENFVQAAIMGSIYADKILKLHNPKVGLLNIGEEETKGNEQAKAAHALLKNEKNINFIGNIEGRDINHDVADVVVCDGFVGNVVLKFGEGLAKAIFQLIKESIEKAGFLAKIGAYLMKPALAGLKKHVDPNEAGGCLLLGIKAPFVICHGNSKAKAITNAIGTTIEFVKEDVVNIIQEKIAESNKGNEE